MSFLLGVLCVFVCTGVLAHDAASEEGWQLLPEDCGRVDSRSTDHPWTVLLEYTIARSSKKMYGCQGSVINERYVITAAHCIHAIPGRISLTGVVAGDPSSACQVKDGQPVCQQVLPIQQAFVHPDYSQTSSDHLHDVGLIRLERPLALSGDYPRPVCLPRGTKVTEIHPGQTATVAVRDVNGGAGLNLHELQLPVFSDESCKAQFPGARLPVSTGQLCAGGRKGEDACHGDGGGALVVNRNDRHYLLGIVSFGANPCGREGWPSVYTRVDQYMPWILGRISE